MTDIRSETAATSLGIADGLPGANSELTSQKEIVGWGESHDSEQRMISPDMPWSTAAAIVCAACLVGGGTIAFIIALYRDEQRRKLGHFDARVGRDCWKDIKGLTR